MFRAIYPSASKFKYIAQTLAKIVDEIPFYAEPDALEVRVLSPDKTTMTILKIPSIAFEEYICEEETFFVVSSDEFNRIARRGTRNDLVILELDGENKMLKFMFKDKKTGIERVFLLSLKERVSERLPEPSIELAVSARMLSDDYKNIIRDLKIVGEEAIFMYKDEKLVIKSMAQQKEYEGVFEQDNPLITLTATVEKALARYSIGLLEATLKAAAASKNVEIQFDTDKPLRVEFELPTGGSIIYWIAPRSA